MTTAELDVCPVCGFVARARAAEPGLCIETFRHPGAQGTIPAPGTGGPGGGPAVMTDGRARTQLVRVNATWVMPRP